MPRRHWGAYVAAVGIAFATPVASQPAQNRAAVAVEHDRNSNGDYSGPNPLLPPVLLRPIQTQTYSFQPAADQQSQAHSDDVKWTDIAIVFLTFVLAACGVVGARIAYIQWKALRDQVTKLGEAIQAEINSGNARADENAKALEAAHAANEIAREMGRAGARAYLTIFESGVFTNTTPGFPCFAFIKARNTGATPCRWVEIESNAQLVPASTKAGDIPPNTRGTSRRWPLDISGDERLSCRPDCGQFKEFPALIEYGQKTKQLLVLQGALRWETVFGEIFESEFFFWGSVSPHLLEFDEKKNVFDVPNVMNVPPVELATLRKIRGAEDADQGQ